MKCPCCNQEWTAPPIFAYGRSIVINGKMYQGNPSEVMTLDALVKAGEEGMMLPTQSQTNSWNMALHRLRKFFIQCNIPFRIDTIRKAGSRRCIYKLVSTTDGQTPNHPAEHPQAVHS